MKMHMFTIYDSSAEVYGRPFFSSSRNSAMRSFRDEVNRKDPDNLVNKHPGDFVLFYLGQFDDSQCSFELSGVEQLLRGIDAVENGNA